MHVLLEKLLKKRGIGSSTELSTDKLPGQPSEQETFEEWDRILSQSTEIRVEDIKSFCGKKIAEIQKAIRDPENKERLTHLATMLDVFSLIVEAIGAPQVEREQLEKHLNELVNQ